MVTDRRKERFFPKEANLTSFTLSQYAAGFALAPGDVPVFVLSGREVRALQGH